MVKPRFRIYYKGKAPEGAVVVQPAIATRNHTVGDPFPFLGAGWEMIGICRFLCHKDKHGVEICEGDVIKMPDESLGVVWYNDGDCSYTIVTADDTYVLGYTKDGVVAHEIIGNKFVMAEVGKAITDARIERYNREG